MLFNMFYVQLFEDSKFSKLKIRVDKNRRS